MVLYPFTWPGSKYRARKFVTGHLPSNKPEGPVQTYVEPFGGSGVVMLNRDPAPVEVFNDLDSNLVTFFRVLRERPKELQRALALTPYSRKEFEQACEADLSASGLDDLERARLFFVRVQQSVPTCGTAPPTSDWLYNIGSSRRGRSKGISSEQSKVEGLLEVGSRFRRVQLESRPYEDVIERFDTPETLFYCDPPYPESIANTSTDDRAYVEHLSEQDHRDLLTSLSNAEGMAAVSGFMNDLYIDVLDGMDTEWYVMFADEQTSTANRKDTSVTRTNQEVLWTNYDPAEFSSDTPAPTAAQSTLD